MEARIQNLRGLAKYRNIADFENIRQQSIREAEKKRHQEWIQNQLQRVPPRYLGKTFSDYEACSREQITVKTLAQRYVKTFSERKNEGANLIFSGANGTGKTFLSLVMYQFLVTSGHSVVYEPSLQFLRSLQESNFNSSAAFHTSLQRYKRAELLIIDEVTESSSGKGGFLSEWEKQMLFTVIDMRYRDKLGTLVITNRDKETMLGRLGNNIIDRLYHNSVLFAFKWNSYRQ